MANYDATFDIDQPEKSHRVHAAARALAIAILTTLGGSIVWLFGVLYLAVPVVASVLIWQKGADRYLAESQGKMTKWLRYIVAFYAYIFLLTDKFPNQDPSSYMRFEVTPSGTPSAGKALLRMVLAVPSVLVLLLIGIAAGVLAFVAAFAILITGSYPGWIYRFLRASVRRHAKLLAYLACLVEGYPPFAINMGLDRPKQD